MPKSLDRNVVTNPWGGGQVLIQKSEFLSSLPACDLFFFFFFFHACDLRKVNFPFEYRE